MGPKADNFRPLGMPNTLDRLVDGTVAAHLMHHTAHLLHPSQTVMSYFKEPQRAVAEIQRIIDGAHPACALLADLSKAFERVNPYFGSYIFYGFGVPLDGSSPMPDLFCFVEELCIRCKADYSQVGQFDKELTWAGHFRCTYFALRWILSFII